MHRAYGYSQIIPSRKTQGGRGRSTALSAVPRWNHSTATEEPGAKEAHLLEDVQEGVCVRAFVCACVMRVLFFWNHCTATEEPGAKEAHLLEDVHVGVCVCARRSVFVFTELSVHF